MKKDKSILDLIEKLTNFPFIVCDRWFGDLCAIGYTSEDRPEKLVYISTYNRNSLIRPLEIDGRYYYEVEDGGSGTPETIETGIAKTFDDLVKMLERHLL